MVLARNGRLAGALPARLTDLGRLEEFLAADTNLCAPSDAGFLDWLSGVPKRRVGSCGAEAPPAAYLTQAVQSRDHPVPLVAGDEALLRVFVESSRESGGRIPSGAGHLLSEWGEDARGGHSREAGPDTTGDQGG